MYKPYQQPRPEIVGTVVAPHSKGVIAMGAREDADGPEDAPVQAHRDLQARARRSMTLMAEEVMPRVNAAIGAGIAPAGNRSIAIGVA